MYYIDKEGVSKQQLCSDLNLKYSTFAEWVNARAYPRIGTVELLAHYFGCEKSDLMEGRLGEPVKDDGLSEAKKALIQFAYDVPEENAEMYLRVMKSIVGDD